MILPRALGELFSPRDDVRIEIYSIAHSKVKRTVVLSGYANGKGVKSDANGFIVRHDGSLTDLLWRIGVRHCITVETTGATSLDRACAVNLAWIFGISDIVKKERDARRSIQK